MENEFNRIGKLLSQTSRTLQSQIERRFRELDIPITYEQMTIITVFCTEIEMGYSQLEIAEKTGRDQPCTSRLIDNLMKQNLLIRTPDENDRRVKMIYLTDEGKEMVKRTRCITEQVVNEATNGLCNNELNTCKKVLQQLHSNLQFTEQ